MDALVLALRVLLSLGAVLAVIWYVQRRVGRRAKAKRTREIVVLSRAGLGSKASVVAIESNGRRFLLGVTDHSVNVLHEEALAVPIVTAAASAPEAAPDQPSAPAAEFARVLSEAGHTAEPLLRRPRRAAQQPLSGSILSPGTWLQTADFLRQRR